MQRIAPSRPAVAAVLGTRMHVQLSVQPSFYRATVLFHRLLASPAQSLCLGRPPKMLPSSLAGGPWGTYMPATPREKKNFKKALVNWLSKRAVAKLARLQRNEVGDRRAVAPPTDRV